MILRRALLVGCVLALNASCGGGSAGPNPLPTATPTPLPTPTPTPTPANLMPETYCVPAPPALRSLRVKIHLDLGYKKIVDSRALVGPSAEYCSSIGYPGEICVVRNEDDPQAVTCNNLVMGQALDTKRYGPTWYWNGRPCRGISEGGNEAGCRNHETNQFLAYAFGPGIYEACGQNDVCNSVLVE